MTAFHPIATRVLARNTARRNVVALTSKRCYAMDFLAKKERGEGTIASVFASLSGETAKPLPDRFRDLKREIVKGEDQANALKESFVDLCETLRQEVDEIAQKGTQVIPEVSYDEIQAGPSAKVLNDLKKRGAFVVRNVVPSETAEKWLTDIQEYIRKNPSVKGFPEDEKQVFELYWSKPQLDARSHPRSLSIQKFLLSLFHTGPSTPSGSVSLDTPLSYCDRMRIRLPGDAKFALGPHCDGGSVERWEDEMYRGSYKEILEGRWRGYDAWDVATRPQANMNLYDGPGACGVFRALQGWTALSATGPGEGTLKVLPLIKESTAYMLLRPFFRQKQSKSSLSREDYLRPSNWELDLESSNFPNSPLGRSQEFNDDTHPHLELDRSVVSIKKVQPGDQAWWHCDGIHAVESIHNGPGPAAVFYIPSVPLTAQNAGYIRDQAHAFRAGKPPPDFPGGVGESMFEGRGGIEGIGNSEGRRAMGLESLVMGENAVENRLKETANAIISA